MSNEHSQSHSLSHHGQRGGHSTGVSTLSIHQYHITSKTDNMNSCRHVVLGFSGCGHYIISYCCEVSLAPPTTFYRYSLHWWNFDLYRKLREVCTHVYTGPFCDPLPIIYGTHDPPLCYICRWPVVIYFVTRRFIVSSIS